MAADYQQWGKVIFSKSCTVTVSSLLSSLCACGKDWHSQESRCVSYKQPPTPSLLSLSLSLCLSVSPLFSLSHTDTLWPSKSHTFRASPTPLLGSSSVWGWRACLVCLEPEDHPQHSPFSQKRFWKIISVFNERSPRNSIWLHSQNI